MASQKNVTPLYQIEKSNASNIRIVPVYPRQQPKITWQSNYSPLHNTMAIPIQSNPPVN
jgi:hypothetical protein